MATYVNNLRLKEITTGDEDGTWGHSTNTNIELIADSNFPYNLSDNFIKGVFPTCIDFLKPLFPFVYFSYRNNIVVSIVLFDFPTLQFFLPILLF